MRSRINEFNVQFGGKPCAEKSLGADDADKAGVDARLAAVDLLEAMAFTPLSLCLKNSIAAASSNTVRSMEIMARHFERFAGGEEAKEQANKGIGDHLLAFARQFSADPKAAPPP